VIVPAALNIGGVNQGVGGAMTLTPQDVDAIIRECSAVSSLAPIVLARTHSVSALVSDGYIENGRIWPETGGDV